jgi:hypothetical protein
MPDSAAFPVGAGVFSFKQPSDFVHFLAASNEGLEVKQLSVVGFADYYFGLDVIPHFGASKEPIRSGLFVGGYFGYSRTTIGIAGSTVASTGTDHLLFAPQVGYQYFPVGSVLYVAPSVAVGLSPKIGGSDDVGDRHYHEPVAMPLAFLNVGVEL